MGELMPLRYATIEKNEIINGTGVGVSLYVQGCGLHCKGCFNPETWDFTGGKNFDEDAYKQLNELLDKPYITRFCILGGEPLERCNWESLEKLMLDIRKNYPTLKI